MRRILPRRVQDVKVYMQAETATLSQFARIAPPSGKVANKTFAAGPGVRMQDD